MPRPASSALALSVLAVLGAVAVALAPSLLDASTAGAASFPPARSASSAPGGGPLAFDLRTVENIVSTGEPTVYAVDDNLIYVVAPESSTGLWRSTDGGKTWERLASTDGGSGDSDIAMDADGVLYVSDMLDDGLLSKLPVSTSLDGGLTYAREVHLWPQASGIDYDRQWMTAWGSGNVVVTARAGSIVHAWVSNDHAQTFDGPFLVAQQAYTQGPLALGDDGTIYTAYESANGVGLATSTDGGRTWTWREIVDLDGGVPILFPVVDADSAGNVYVAWSHGGGFLISSGGQIRLTMSTDGGATWSQPRALSDPGKIALFPWIQAGAPGKVDVSFVMATPDVGPQPLGPDTGGPTTTWDVYMAQGLGLDTTTPTWKRALVAESFHTGSICTTGILCVGPQNALGMGNVPTPFDRRHLDFFSLDITPSGKALVAFTQSRPMVPPHYVGDLLLSWVDLKVARQTGGDVVG